MRRTRSPDPSAEHPGLLRLNWRARVRGFLARDLTTANLTERLLEIHGDRLAVRLDPPGASRVQPADRLTYGDLHGVTTQLAGALARAGIGRGQVVAVAVTHRFDLVLWCLAVWRLGAVVVPLGESLTADEVQRAVTDARATALIVDASANVAALVRVLPAVRVLFEGPPGEAPTGTRTLDHAVVGEALPATPVGPDDPCAILQTSGTTGVPKGAVHTAGGFLRRMHPALLYPSTRQAGVLVALPTAHIMGLVSVLLPLIAGVPLTHLCEFDARRVLGAIERTRPTLVAGVPAMFRLMADAGLDAARLDSVRAWVSAADVMPVPLMAEFKRRGALFRTIGWTCRALFVDVYGSVELGGAALVRLSSPFRAGRGEPPAFPLPGCRTRVVDEDGRPVRAGRVGELWVRAPSVFRGYVDDATDGIGPGGWLQTGDLASKSLLGSVRLVGRQKDVIKHGGYSVFPAEIERVLGAHPDVRRAVAFGVPDPIKGETPAVAVVLRGGTTMSADALAEYCRASLADYKVPRQIHIVDGDLLPYNRSLKVVRGVLAGRFVGYRHEDAPAG